MSMTPMGLIEITGKDLSILIGRRAETLNSLQDFTSLICTSSSGIGPDDDRCAGVPFRREWHCADRQAPG